MKKAAKRGAQSRKLNDFNLVRTWTRTNIDGVHVRSRPGMGVLGRRVRAPRRPDARHTAFPPLDHSSNSSNASPRMLVDKAALTRQRTRARGTRRPCHDQRKPGAPIWNSPPVSREVIGRRRLGVRLGRRTCRGYDPTRLMELAQPTAGCQRPTSLDP